VDLSHSNLRGYIQQNFPKSAQSALELLPASFLPSQPLYDLLEGFKMDLCFIRTTNDERAPFLPEDYPIRDDEDLELYASRVASTVGELCLWLVFHHGGTKVSDEKRYDLIRAAKGMGHALQYVNISRDITVDAAMDRVYLPTTWLREEFMTPRDIVSAPREPVVKRLRLRLLAVAFEEYRRARYFMEILPPDVRGPLVVAVESYMDIGRVLLERNAASSRSRSGRATVPRARRLWVAWKVLASQ
jgi:15-cis-phytoene synthase / lycopene beta-cyclase